MQSLREATAGHVSPERCAREVLVGVPAVMRFIRCQMRRNRQADLTVPQFRALVFLSHSEDASLSAMAEHLGLSLPAASRMMDVLVRRGLVRRRDQPRDRRRVSLSLTPRGRSAFEAAFAATHAAMSRSLKSIPREELALIHAAMRTLSRTFAPGNCRAISPSRRRTAVPDGAVP